MDLIITVVLFSLIFLTGYVIGFFLGVKHCSQSIYEDTILVFNELGRLSKRLELSGKTLNDVTEKDIQEIVEKVVDKKSM